jgi:hypothetical protein
VNLSVFCDCLEEAIGKISVSGGLFFDPPLAGLVLPRSWLSSNKDFSGKKAIEIPLLVELLDCVRDLLISLQSGSAGGEHSKHWQQSERPADFKIKRDMCCHIPN